MCIRDRAGDWYSLFHAINEMATILSAHAENQRRTREFLQDMISDVSHQMKTPLSALKMYLEIIESHKDDAAAVSSFTGKSQREIRRMEDVISVSYTHLDVYKRQLHKRP